MSPILRRFLFWLPVLVAVAAGFAWLLGEQPVPVDIGVVDRGELVVSIEEEGRTLVRERYRVLAPVSGTLARIALDPGDPVETGTTVVARIEPAEPSLLDLRTRLERLAALQSAEAAVAEAEAQVEQARAARDYAERERERVRRLVDRRAAPAAELDRAERDLRAREAELSAAEAALGRARAERDRVRASLLDPAVLPEGTATTGGCCVPVLAPATGRVLRVLREDAGPVEAGTPLLEIGDPRDLEVSVELLTRDAARIREGAEAQILDWGGGFALSAHVRRIGPSAFTKVSALGVEEQRVEVRLAFDDPGQLPEQVGDGWRVLVRITAEQFADVVRVPAGALFRDADGWAAFAVVDGRAKLRRVETGARNERFAQALSGLEPGERVVLWPSDRVADGVAVTPRPAGG